MERHAASRALFAATLLTVVGGCHGVTTPAVEPISAGATFVLESVGPAKIPSRGTDPAGATLVADTLVFISRDANGAGQFDSREVWTIGSVRSGSTPLVGSYGWYNGLLNLSWPLCPPNALCRVYGSIAAAGRFGSGTLTITYESAGWVTRTFRQVN